MTDFYFYKGLYKVKVLTESEGYWIVEAQEDFEDYLDGKKIAVKRASNASCRQANCIRKKCCLRRCLSMCMSGGWRRKLNVWLTNTKNQPNRAR